MIQLPNIGEIITLETGDATVLDIANRYGDITLLAGRAHPFHPFATWKLDTFSGALFAGHYFKDLAEAEIDFNQR